jgi:hypothetical protein
MILRIFFSLKICRCGAQRCKADATRNSLIYRAIVIKRDNAREDFAVIRRVFQAGNEGTPWPAAWFATPADVRYNRPLHH